MSIKLCSNDQVYKKEPTTVGITSGFNYQISKKEPKKVNPYLLDKQEVKQCYFLEVNMHYSTEWDE